jgi:hypothetical protein
LSKISDLVLIALTTKTFIVDGSEKAIPSLMISEKFRTVSWSISGMVKVGFSSVFETGLANSDLYTFLVMCRHPRYRDHLKSELMSVSLTIEIFLGVNSTKKTTKNAECNFLWLNLRRIKISQ